VGLSLTPALAGHASSGRWVPLAIPADTIHVGAMACWLGGLVIAFAVVMPRKDPDEMRTVLVRFSGLALASVVALVVTGGFQAYRQVGSINALKDTDYGRILIVKLVVFAALIVAAAFSREVVNRQFRTYDDEEEAEAEDGDDRDGVAVPDRAEPVAVGAGSGPRRSVGGGSSLPEEPVLPDDDDEYEVPDFDSDVRRLRRSLLIEIVIATLVLGVTALLVNAAPARTVTNEPVSLALRNSKAWVDVTLAPGNAGGNDVHVTALPVGGGLTTIADLQIQLTKVGADLPPFDVPLQKLGEGHYYAPLYDIPYPGQWRLIARVRLSETEETVLTGKFSLR
jgi:copper transport protein